MIAIFDAAYGDNSAAAACVLASSWECSAPNAVHTTTTPAALPYRPGEFYQRELPLILEVMPPEPFDYAIIDGYVWLGPDRIPGLGAHLHSALGERIPVVGIAKTQYANTPAKSVVRGLSKRPLFITAIGVDLDMAARLISGMHGSSRLPTLIKHADKMARSALGSPLFD